MKYFLPLFMMISISGNAEKIKVTYYSNYHNNALYNFYPEHSKGEVLTQSEAQSRPWAFKEVVTENEINLYSLDKGTVYAIATLNLQEQTLYEESPIHSCSFNIENNLIEEVCYEANGEVYLREKSFYYNNVLTKIEKFDKTDRIISYSIFDYSSWVEYIFSPDGSLLKKDELMKPGK